MTRSACMMLWVAITSSGPVPWRHWRWNNDVPNVRPKKRCPMTKRRPGSVWRPMYGNDFSMNNGKRSENWMTSRKNFPMMSSNLWQMKILLNLMMILKRITKRYRVPKVSPKSRSVKWLRTCSKNPPLKHMIYRYWQCRNWRKKKNENLKN